jgi:hypothetical protein
MVDDAFLRHHRGFQNLLDSATAELPAVQQDHIREAVFARQDAGEARAFIDGTDAEGFGGRFLAAFAEAESELTADQVDELEGLVDARLAHP